MKKKELEKLIEECFFETLSTRRQGIIYTTLHSPSGEYGEVMGEIWPIELIKELDKALKEKMKSLDEEINN